MKNFDVSRYTGTWYEIARLDYTFERGLINCTANYSLNEDGSVRVVNRGYDPRLDRWKEATGKAYFVDAPNIGRLKVSFFGPFYAGYNIIDLDEQNYSYALVCGNDKSYLWILARERELPDTVKTSLLKKAKDLGFEIDELVYVQKQP